MELGSCIPTNPVKNYACLLLIDEEDTRIPPYACATDLYYDLLVTKFSEVKVCARGLCGQNHLPGIVRGVYKRLSTVELAGHSSF